ncbi:helix-turn-helix domain-containing protein [Neomegalonema sp.]|uniref:helix-turn-helix domain-containing protein n=1 Tax=Neomegalonema sp. TaxID=2039713 RepID=UPI0026092F53|nr:helix-turn-helix domain-containing protein [Neomegalonema sp.]MDD2867720.1 helix-turn-helix domain-containing protein [Neomegalonema sp.]
MNSDEGFSARLKIALGKRSGSWLGRQLGVAGSTVNDWLRGDSEPVLSNLIKSAETLGISVQWLATGEGSMIGSNPKSTHQEPVDKWLLTKAVEGVRRTYKRVGGQIQAAGEVELAFEMHDRIVTLAAGQEARHGALLMALDQLEKDLIGSAKTKEGGDKRTAQFS